MIEKGTAILRIMDLIDKEKRNSRRYCEINPQDKDHRKEIERLIISAYMEVLYTIAE